ncbi:hypothetical protein AMK68_05590 [candidate division KD3-62 bacterium DG_56]|uniref:Uncharacterized protein n=1 Tax=candidate division KD3-62 bacterium DG_56 TaxID=1704032 RepID=A0A0S7XHK9_9BACT|nr:MAG: hypothetical protein AMK68_05590 [candidate division KD3-62 bacterium DG_56]
MERYFPTFMPMWRRARRALPRFLRIGVWPFRQLGRGILRGWPWLAGILVVLLLAHTIFNIVATRELGRELARLKANGCRLTLPELAPPPVPNEENAALIYERAFELLPSDDVDSAFWRAVAFAFPTRYGGTEHPATHSQAATFIRQHQRVLDLLRKGAAMPKARYQVNWEAPPFEIMLPHAAQIRDSVRLLGVDAVLKSRRGDAAGALADIGVMLKTGDTVSPEPALVSQLGRVACYSIASETLNTVMNNSAPSAEDCRSLHLLLSHIDLMRPFTHALKGDRVWGLWAFHEVRRSPAALLATAQDEAESTAKWPFWTAPLRLLWAPWLKKDELFYLRYMERVIALSRKPYRENAYATLHQQWERAPRYALVTRILVPVTGKVTWRRDEGIARIGLAQWALALRVYQERMGHYPHALSDVCAVVDWSLPDDPLSGQPFVYRREGDGYILYSFGFNRHDDGGKKERRKFRPYGPALTEAEYLRVPDDIVWRMTR